LTSKYGFSVVAPISVTSPSSTAGRSASCWALLKRWISSRKKFGGASDHLAHLGAARLHGRELLEGRVGVLGGEPRERRLPRPGRPVEHHRMRPPGLERLPQRRPLAEQVLLADELVQRLRSHAGGERPVGRRPVVRAFLGRVEEALHTSIFAQPWTFASARSSASGRGSAP
jgi:hypothetical protein